MSISGAIQRGLIGAFPDGDPTPPPGELAGAFSTIIGVAKWIGLGVAVIAMVVLGIMLMTSRSGDGQRHVGRLAYIIGGVFIVVSAATILAFLTGY